MKTNIKIFVLFVVALNLCSSVESLSQIQKSEFPTVLSLRNKSEPSTVEYDPVMSLIYLPGKLNGRDSCWFILDSGFPHTLVNRDRLDTSIVKLGLAFKEVQPGGQVEVQAVYGIEIDIGDVLIAADSMRSYPFGGLESITGRRFDGIVGHDLFDKFVVTIDYVSNTVRLENAESFNYSGNGTSVKVTVIDNEPFIYAEIKHPDGTWRKAKLKIDTGSIDFIGFNGSYVKAENLVTDNQPKIPTTGAAAGGNSENWVTRINEFRIKDLTFSNPVVGYSVDTLRSGDAGTIGGEFLSRFTVIFDYPHDRIILEPNKNFSRGFEFDMSGIFPITKASDFSTKVVMDVRPGSPAYEAGIVAGDTLVRIDEIDCVEMSISDIRNRFMTPGKVAVLIRSGESSRETVMLLKPQI